MKFAHSTVMLGMLASIDVAQWQRKMDNLCKALVDLISSGEKYAYTLSIHITLHREDVKQDPCEGSDDGKRTARRVALWRTKYMDIFRRWVQIKEDCQIPRKELAEKELITIVKCFDGVMGWRKSMGVDGG